MLAFFSHSLSQLDGLVDFSFFILSILSFSFLFFVFSHFVVEVYSTVCIFFLRKDLLALFVVFFQKTKYSN
jgi:hypothetical protein